jgi:hypothetical protein
MASSRRRSARKGPAPREAQRVTSKRWDRAERVGCTTTHHVSTGRPLARCPTDACCMYLTVHKQPAVLAAPPVLSVDGPGAMDGSREPRPVTRHEGWGQVWVPHCTVRYALLDLEAASFCPTRSRDCG